MISFNKNFQNILVATKDKKIAEGFDLHPGEVFFSSKDKTFYLLLVQSDISKVSQLKLGLKYIVSKNLEPLSINFASFISIISELESKALFKVIAETILFEAHQKVAFKNDAKIVQREYDIITTLDFSKELKQVNLLLKYVSYARNLQDTPPNIGTSEYYGQKILKDCAKIEGLKVSILKNFELESLNMNLILAVNQGSNVPVNVVVIEYKNSSEEKNIGLIGKGICFDTGGYNLKPSASMEGMKFDMSGAAIILATAMGLAEAKAKINFVAVVPFTDNRLGCQAILPESVITSMSGLSVEINNTDAEGRLVLADAISYAVNVKKVSEIYDVATLTGATALTLGESASGVFTEYDYMWKALWKTSQLSGEKIWRLPIFEEHKEQVQSGTLLADLTNSCKQGPGGSTAAAFLTFFAQQIPFLHIDASRVVRTNLQGQGFLVKTLIEHFKNEL